MGAVQERRKGAEVNLLDLNRGTAPHNIISPPLTRFNHLIAIERTGMAADGNYYNARKINIKHLVDPIDELFLAAQNIPGITTTGKCGAIFVQ